MEIKNNNLFGDVFEARMVSDKYNTITVPQFNRENLWVNSSITEMSIAGDTFIDSKDYQLKHGENNIKNVELDVLYEAIGNSIKFSKISFNNRNPTQTEFVENTFDKILKLNNDFYEYIWIVGPKSFFNITKINPTTANIKQIDMFDCTGLNIFKKLCVICSPYTLNIVYDDYIIGIPKNKMGIYHTNKLEHSDFKYAVVSTTTDEIVYFPINF